MPEAFKHGLLPTDVEQILGYTKCLNSFYKHLATVTDFKPEKRYVDAVEMLDIIAETNKELSGLLAQAGAALREIESKLLKG